MRATRTHGRSSRSSLRKTTRMYILTRRDISPGYQGVQSCHAVAELLAKQSRPKGWDDTMVWLSCADERELLTQYQMAERHKLNPVKFTEPDLFHRVTAFAVFVPEEKYSLFAHLPLSLNKRKLSTAEALFTFRMACRNLASVVLGELHLHQVKTRLDRETAAQVSEFGTWMGEWAMP